MPALNERYATITEPDPWSDGAGRLQDSRLIEILSRYGPADWWLGYLDTGSSDVVFPRAPKVQLYPSWLYTVVQAGPARALTWRDDLPDLIFPTDRSWSVNTLWDDSWTCVGGSSDLVEALVEDHLVAGRRVELGADATPPGHISF